MSANITSPNETSTHQYRLISILVAGMLGFTSLQSVAFDFKGALKDAVEKEISQQSESPTTPTDAASATETAKSNNTTASSETTFNWKNPSTAEEITLGREIAGNLLGAAPLVKDATLQKYVNSVGRWVASQSERPELPWRFGVIESEDLNAFAAPGGYIMLTKGLYRKLQNEAQLAGVLGHEIAHVVKKHQLKVLQKQQLLNIGAGLLSEKYAKDNVLISKAIGSGAEISARSLDKSAEYEADRLGLSYATRAGYEPYGLTDVLQTLGQSNTNDASVALLFKTHPHPDERLSALSESVGGQLDKMTNGKTLEKRFYLLK
ncbi:M48 family metallopeptidase [Methylotenera sp.]|uniref:M48 family metallopeptidase n=1 Tax=Methylotenera sp. TaxID=2051956 RepID=UPI0027324440|nr:M48 family metallopeptidase [Methylotenera sp.]MDP3776409.1 M48 family metallopeptidase [Methylotenera sp.]